MEEDELSEDPPELVYIEHIRPPLGAKKALTAPFRKLHGAVFEGVYLGPGQVEHIASIRESTAHDYLYNCLSILDTKSSALLQYDGIVLAAATLGVTLFPHPSLGNLFVILALLLSGVSSVLCLPVIWVYWTTTPEFSDEREEFIDLLGHRNRRTVYYRIAWLIAQAAVFFLVLGIIIRQA
jgi:hypothetical protein